MKSFYRSFIKQVFNWWSQHCNSFHVPSEHQIRHYFHVMDLANGHVATLRKLFTTQNIGCVAYNLGINCATFVLEMVTAFEKASGKVGKSAPVPLIYS
ncbi:hypothetical protein QQP08_017191 [Theobroma cacao]|nr:hypothetical protein QQP08_017191 [Theobroma cacao]